jgi:two-component system, LytTR family, sensor kinase
MYTQARPLSDNLSKSILMLSDLMRYSLKNTDNTSWSSLENEIEFLENFIEIHRLRFYTNFNLNFQVEGFVRDKKIAPLIFITFVENAIKHGILNDPKHPITILLSVGNTGLDFMVKNHKQHGFKDKTSGIGLENTKNRLKLMYPDKYQITIQDKAHFYTVSLQLTF